jgi:colicin import membrane protein
MAKSELKPMPLMNRPARPSDGVGRVWKWVIISGVIHVAVITFLFVGPILRGNKSTPPPVYTVDIVGGEKLGGGAGTALAPEPKAKPEPQAPEVKSPPPVKETKKAKETVKPPRDEVKEAKEAKAKAEMLERVKAKKEAEEKKKAEAEAKRKADAEEAAAAKARLEELNKRRTEAALQDIRERIKARDAAEKAAADRAAAERQAKSNVPGDAPGAAVLGGGGTGGGIVKSAEFIRYQNIIQDRVRSSWTWVGRRNDLKVTVNLSIQDNGEITGIKLVGTSGDRSFDESVVRAIRRSNPLPAPPDTFRKDFSDVNVQFSSKELGS